MSGSGLAERGMERWRGGGNMTVVNERVKAMKAPALMGVLDTSSLSE